MNLLIDRPPTSVWIGDVEYEIRSDFRISILYEQLLLDPEVPPDEKIPAAFRLYYTEIPENTNEAAEAMLWFYQGGKEICEMKGRAGGSGPERIYSFDFDDTYIYAAFMEQYGIDLNDVEYMHWWKFRALFHALKEDTEIRKIMGYRAVVIPKDMDPEKKKFYMEMKEQYRIPMARSEQEKLDAIEQALLNGGDLTGLL